MRIYWIMRIITIYIFLFIHFNFYFFYNICGNKRINFLFMLHIRKFKYMSILRGNKSWNKVLKFRETCVLMTVVAICDYKI